MTLTKFGIREWGGSGIIALALIGLCVWLALKHSPVAGISLGSLVFIIWLVIAAFFRNPSRTIPAGGELILSPADGVVKDIEVISNCEIDCFKDGKALRVGIFLSVLNVHLNRAPCELTVEYKQYREGRYLDARNPNCAKENEAMTIGGKAMINGVSFPIGIRQISGAIARRIVCSTTIGSKLAKGEIYGMIKFGSRTEIYLPVSDDFKLKVNIGDKVFAGVTTIATLTKK
ncbi:MAG: phosphatidylserine decarboxylase [Victivallaceae bacterium]